MICGGTGCLANDSDAILHEFEKQIKEKGLREKVSVNHVGCFGFCSQGPFVKIFPEDTLYHKVKVSDVSHIVDDDLIGGKSAKICLCRSLHPRESRAARRYQLLQEAEAHFLHGCSLINPDFSKSPSAMMASKP
jgi:NADH-quinone oxidoreductase subunit F/NADP-reducing hydrogenase subunit HndC